MAGKPVIMLQIADRAWTLDALHCACRMARRSPAVIALVSMIPVQHTGWLGTDWGFLNFSQQDKRDLEDYQATVLDYGLECGTVRYQYTDFADALGDMADELDAQIVFARLPVALIPGWQRFRLWRLNRRLAGQQRQLIAQPGQLLTPAPMIDERARETSRA